MILTQKLSSKRGETLAETLVSIAILGMSIALMLTMVMTSSKITQDTREKDEELMDELNAAEQQAPDKKSDLPVDVTIEAVSGASGTIKVPVYVYTEDGEGTLVSYSTDTH